MTDTHAVAGRQSRAERARMPLAADVVRAVAEANGVCVRPVPLRRTDLATGEESVVDVPCGSTRAAVCPPCAERKKRLRMAQCREGWHLAEEPDFTLDPSTEEQRFLVTMRADAEKARAEATQAGQDTAALDEVIADIDAELTRAGVRGHAASGRQHRRSRSTRRRQDAPDLPKRKVENRTVGRAFVAPDGTVFRPSMFVTLTCDSYGRVQADGTPVDPARYDYRRAARDAIHFSKLVDRFFQNLRRVAGYDVQYFATVEPQRRLAPHLHVALRGTTVKEVAYLLTLSLGNTYELIRAGTIPAHRLGRRWVIPRARFHAWLDSLTVEPEPQISATPPSVPGPRRGGRH
jgi:excisionase family DNA binding protein